MRGITAGGLARAAVAAAFVFSSGAVQAEAQSALAADAAYRSPPPLDILWSPNLDVALEGTPAPIATTAPNAIVIDVETGEILGAKTAERAISPASMTKLMTALLVFEALERGELSLDEEVQVSARAAGQPGSTMGLRAGQRPSVDALLRGLIIASGNDAAVTLAERLAGSEAAFAAAMTARAQELGLESAQFQNATGFTASGHHISVADIAALSAHLIAEHPEHFAFFAESSMRFNGVRRWNRNPTLDLDLRDLGAWADGLKTGHTRAAGYCLAASAIVETAEGPRRVVVVIAGLPSERARAREAERVLRWAIDMARN